MKKNRYNHTRSEKLAYRKKCTIRRFSIAIIILLIAILSVITKFRYDQNKSKDINYTIKKYFTTGIINKYKMNDVNFIKLTFSDGKTAVVKVDGLQEKTPHRRVSYSVFLEKGETGTWKVTRVFNI